MRRFLLLASALVALAVLSATGAATAKVPPKHKRTSHAGGEGRREEAREGQARSPGEGQAAAHSRAADGLRLSSTRTTTRSRTRRGRGNAVRNQEKARTWTTVVPVTTTSTTTTAAPARATAATAAVAVMTTAAVEAATTSAVEPLSCRGRPDGAAAARTAEIFERHGPTVLGLCRMLLRNEHEAEDASQQTFLAAYRSIRNGVEPRHPAAWLATIARNECWAAIERRMREPFHQGEFESGLPDPVVQAAANADLEELWRAIGELPRQQRRALLLREFSGLTYAELAGALGVTEPAVESLLVRARRELRGRLRPVYGSFMIAPLNAARDALAPVAVKLGVGATAVVVAAGTVAAVETHTLRRELAVNRLSPPCCPSAHARSGRAGLAGGATRQRSHARPSPGSGPDAPLHTRPPATGPVPGAPAAPTAVVTATPPVVAPPAEAPVIRLGPRPRRRHLPSPTRRRAATTPPGTTGARSRSGDDGTQGTPSSGDGGTSSGEGGGGVLDDHNGPWGGRRGTTPADSSGPGGGDDGDTSSSSGPGGGGDDAVSGGSGSDGSRRPRRGGDDGEP